MNKNKRFLSLLLAFSMLLPLAAPAANAAEIPVTTDEAVYVNLDYYGTMTDTSIVKGCSLNGNREFFDYGSYQKVNNMSGYDQPELTKEGVKWKLSDDVNDHFFYECTPEENSIILPWNFKVTYKLNGVPAKAESLAGASGMVEMQVECIPNEKAGAYYRDNMLLQAATMVNVEDVLSIEAPGSQTQSIGTYKAIIFAALPGEHTTFTIRIGTENFESSGIILMMIPGTLEQMKNIKKLKEAKDVIGDSADAIYDNLDSILGVLDDMSGSLKLTQQGLKDLQQARNSIHSAKDGLYGGADDSLDDLNRLSQTITTLVPHLKNGESMVGEISGNVNVMVKEVDALQPDLAELKKSLTRLQGSLEDLEHAINDSSISNKQLSSAQDAIDDLSDALSPLQDDIKALKNAINNQTDPLSALLATLKDVRAQLDQTIEELTQQGASDTVLAPLKKNRDRLDENIAALEQAGKKLSDILGNTGNAIGALDDLGYSANKLLESLKGLSDLDSAADVAAELNRASTTLKSSIDTCSSLITALDALNNTLNKYQDGTVSLLSDSAALTQQLSATLESTTAFLKDLENTLRNSGDSLNDGTKQTLDGLIDVLSKALDSSDNTSDLQDANTTIKDTIDEQVDKYEDETKLLDLDAEQEMVSFTSSKNPTPSSIQIILRTEEIQVDEEAAPETDLEQPAEDVGVWDRIVNLFKNIWNSITSLFQ